MSKSEELNLLFKNKNFDPAFFKNKKALRENNLIDTKQTSKENLNPNWINGSVTWRKAL